MIHRSNRTTGKTRNNSNKSEQYLRRWNRVSEHVRNDWLILRTGDQKREAPAYMLATPPQSTLFPLVECPFTRAPHSWLSSGNRRFSRLSNHVGKRAARSLCWVNLNITFGPAVCVWQFCFLFVFCGSPIVWCQWWETNCDSRRFRAAEIQDFVASVYGYRKCFCRLYYKSHIYFYNKLWNFGYIVL